MSLRTVTLHSVLSRNGEESFNECSSPDHDPDHLRGGSNHGYNSSCLKKINRSNIS